MNLESHPESDLLQELLLQWEELYERGQDTPASELAKDHPELIPELARQIDALKTVSWVTRPLLNLPKSEGNSPPPTRATGRVLGGRYRLEALIAEGGFAEVYKAFDTELQRIVAVKIPKRSHLSSAESFLAEARRVARLKHDGIVPVHDVGMDGDACFIVSEFMEGGSLADRLSKSRPSTQDSIRWIADIADALEYAHLNKIIHRDIKPANILLDHHGRAKLADFGIAQSSMKTGEFAPSLGTLRYMSPEQLEGKPADNRSDIYSLGLVLHEMLTGHLPYSSDDPSAIRREIVEGTASLSKSIPHSLLACIRKATHRSPEKRHASAKAFAEDLRRAAAGPTFSRRHFGWAMVLGFMALGTSLWTGRIERGRPEPEKRGLEKAIEAPPVAEPVIPAGHIALQGLGSEPYLAGSVPEAWLKEGVFAEITSPGVARFPRLPESAYVLEADVTFHSPRGHIAIQTGEPQCRGEVSLGDKWPKDRERNEVAVRVFRVHPFGINWSGDTVFQVGRRMTLEINIADDVWVLRCHDLDILRVTGEPTDFSLAIVASGDPNVTIHSLSCHALTEDRARRARLPSPARTYSHDAIAAEKRCDSQIGEGFAADPSPESHFVLGDHLAMRWIHPGEFRMGSANAGALEMGKGTERVQISRGYWIGQYEVTQGQWQALMGSNPSRIQGSPYLPVNYVSWSDARRFCRALDDRERKAGRVPHGYEYRLPTEAEWEYACRAGTDRDLVVPLHELAYRGDRYSSMVEVGTTPANAWGLYETVGNVSEWCLDQWQKYSNDEAGVTTDRFHRGNPAESPFFVLRGHGYWFSEGVPSLFNRFPRQDIAGGFRGFRVALAPVIALQNTDAEDPQPDQPP